MSDLLNILKENNFLETNEKDVFINKLHADYIAKILVYNDAIAYYKIIKISENCVIEYIGDKLVNNLKEIYRNAYNIACLIQNSIKEKKKSLDKINLILKQKYPEWIMSYYY